MNRPFLLPAFLGLIAILLAMLMNLPLRGLHFDAPAPFTNPVLALEFAPSAETLGTLLGSDADGAKVTALRAATLRDNLFVFGYTLFLAALASVVWRQTRRKRYLLLGFLALFIGLSDLMENGAIQMLLSNFQNDMLLSDAMDFRRIRMFAWAKWLGLAVYFGALAPYLWGRGWLLGRGLAIVAGIAVVLAVMARFYPEWIEAYVTAVFAAFPLAVAFCFLKKEAGSEERCV
ncbi:MAG: hypothetical protein IPM98_07320 [Lewinellaceae bacterium]|nr:hypothetical protein [Lewinellaceae bacterium]